MTSRHEHRSEAEVMASAERLAAVYPLGRIPIHVLMGDWVKVNRLIAKGALRYDGRCVTIPATPTGKA